jgi:small subunit ribosomal protein S6
MKKYEAVIIVNPNLSTKISDFKKKLESLLKDNSFKVLKVEDVGRRQLAYSINNHNKGHYLLYNLEGDPSCLQEIETKIKYDESIIRHIFISVFEHSEEDSFLKKDNITKIEETEKTDKRKVKKDLTKDKVEKDDTESQEDDTESQEDDTESHEDDTELQEDDTESQEDDIELKEDDKNKDDQEDKK